MKPHVIYGRAHWETPDAPAASADVGIDRSSEVGFRLVHDDADRVIRGGSWIYTARGARVALRGDFDPTGRFDFLGVRLVFAQVED